MPNRFLKDSICTSEEINKLSDFEETLFYRLIVNADDFGRYFANPQLIAGKCYPLKTSDIKFVSKIQKGLIHLSELNLITIYTSEGKPFLFFNTWKKHQQCRADKSKFPEPDTICKQLISDDNNCEQSQTNAPVFVFDNVFDNRNSNNDICTEPTTVDSPPVVTITLNDKTEYPITQADIDGYISLYPAVDVLQQLRSMKGWCDSNPAKRKTKSGIKRFINAWLAKEQNKGGRSNGTGPGKSETAEELIAKYGDRYGRIV